MKTTSFKSLLMLFLSLSVLIACKKEQQPIDSNPEPPPITSSKNPQAVSAAAKVWHGDRWPGNAPASNGSVLALNAASSGSVTHTFNGQYAIIQPQVTQGSAAGYYLQFNGANEYFNISHRKQRNGRMQPVTEPQSPFTDHDQDGNADNSLVIVLPSILTSPDTICVSYRAYDADGNISNTISSCIIVDPVTTDTTNSWLTGTWRYTAFWDDNYKSEIVYNEWAAVPSPYGYICHYRADKATSYLLSSLIDPSTGPSLVNDSFYRVKQNTAFATNGSWLSDYAGFSETVNPSTSTCSSYSFNSNTSYSNVINGAWNYDAATGKISIIHEGGHNGSTVLQALEYEIVDKNDAYIILSYTGNGATTYYRFER